MYLLHEFAVGIVVVHAALALAYLCGSILRRRVDPMVDSASPVVDIVISTGLGIAAIGFASFFVGMVGLLSPAGFVAVLLAIAAAGWWTQQYVWDVRFWRDRFHSVVLALRSPGLWLIWLFAVALAFPAAQPATAFDALFFHQVYALEWVQHHGIYVDLFRRFPWYAQNWILIYAWFYTFNLGDFVQFINWSTEALSAVLVYGLTREQLPGRSLVSEIAAAVSPLPFFLAPVFLRWSDTGMVDASLAFFFLLSVVAAVKAIVSPSGASWFTTALIGGFFIGMKPTLFPFLLLFALFIAIAMLRERASTRKVTAAVAALVIISSPWYVKNLVQDGDPVPPMFNYLLNHKDGSYSRQDVEAIRSASFQTDGSPLALLRLPVRMFFDPIAVDFQEYGTSAEVFLLGVPFVVLVIGLWRRYYGEPAYWACALVFAFAYWIFTAHLGRYAMLFYPLLTAFNVRVLIAGSRRLLLACGSPNPVRVTTLAAGIGSIVLALPSPVSYDWLKIDYQMSYANAGTIFSTRDSYLEHYPGYPEEEAVSAWLVAHPALPKRVLSFRLEAMAYYFAEHRIQSIGDWIGPARYGDFSAAIAAGQADEYLRGFDVSAVIVPEQNEVLKPPSIRSLGDQLAKAGFHQIQNADSIDVYVRDP